MTTPHVLLYFDVNKTMIMHDPMQGKSLLHILNDLLTERALGRKVNVPDAESKWIWNGESVLDKHLANTREDDTLVSYGAFLRAKFPLSENPEVAKENKHVRKMLRRDFTVIGNPGAGLKSETFGNDLHRVAQEFNCFCEGRHPCFPLAKPMDGSDESVDRRIYLHRTSTGEMPRFGTFLRAEGTTALVMGTFEQPEVTDADPLAFYASQQENVEIVQGLSQIHDFLGRRWRQSQATLALRDYYPYWFHNGQAATAGKLLVLDPTDSANGVHAIFFDDNILPHDAHIVDARNAHNDLALPFERTRELHLMRVEPLDVIQDEKYLIDRFKVSLQRAMKD